MREAYTRKTEYTFGDFTLDESGSAEVEGKITSSRGLCLDPDVIWTAANPSNFVEAVRRAAPPKEQSAALQTEGIAHSYHDGKDSDEAQIAVSHLGANVKAHAKLSELITAVGSPSDCQYTAPRPSVDWTRAEAMFDEMMQSA